MKFGFVTSVKLGLACMEEIYNQGHKLDLVITIPDSKAVKKSGRIYVDEFCAEHDIDLLKVDHINDNEAVSAIKTHGIDWLFIIGWSQIANSNVLDAPNKGVIGMHPTLLPKGRGRAAIPWAIIKRLDKTGVTMFQLDEGVDSGPILDQIEILLDNKIDAGKLYGLVTDTHVELIRHNISKLFNGKEILKEQDDTMATEWPGRKPKDGEIDLTASVQKAEALIRAVTHPYPGAFFYDEMGRKVTVWKATINNDYSGEDKIVFKDGILEILEFSLKA